MNIVFYLSAAVAIAATAIMLTRTNVMHALLYLILSFLAVSLMFYTLGAPFVAALEVIIYAGAIMVLFIFAIMLLNLGQQAVTHEREMLRSSGWIGPAIFALILLGELIFILFGSPQNGLGGTVVDPRQVGISVFRTYLIGVELASILLLASLVGAYHLGQPRQTENQQEDQRVMAAENAQMLRVGPEAPALQVETEKAGKDFIAAPPNEGKMIDPAGRATPSQNEPDDRPLREE